MEKYFPCKTRPDSDPSLVPTLFCYAMLKSQESDRVPRCNQFRTVRRKPVEREEESGKRGGARGERAYSRSQEGLTDTWPLNGANLRAPAVMLLIR